MYIVILLLGFPRNGVKTLCVYYADILNMFMKKFHSGRKRKNTVTANKILIDLITVYFIYFLSNAVV